MPSPVPDPLARARLNAPKPRRRGLPTAYIWLAVAAGGLLLLVIALILGGDADSKRKRNSAKKPPQETKAPPKRERLGSPWGNGRTAPPTGSRTLGDLLQTPDDATGEVKTVKTHLATARSAMARRDMPAAHQDLAAAKQLAVSPIEKQQCERVEVLVKSLDAFWQAVGDASARLRSGEEIEFGSDSVSVVEGRPELLTVREQGNIRLYAPQDLPPLLAVALAERGLKSGDAARDLHIGAFHAMDAHGDRAEARRRWEGKGDVGALLLGELDAAGQQDR